MQVLFEGEGYLAVNKPPGVLVIPGRGEEEGPSLREQLERERGRKIFVVHRLDRDTSGVLLFALDAKAHRTLSMAFEHGDVKKTYLALVKGQLERAIEVSAPLVPARRGRMRVAGDHEEGKETITRFRPVEQLSGASWVEAEPVTGRTHQIRVHLQHLGHPLLFDHQYGSREPLKAGDEVLLSRTPLHAARLVLPALEGISPRTIEAPLAEDLVRTLAHLRRA